MADGHSRDVDTHATEVDTHATDVDTHATDVDTADFATAVVARSHEVPVVVDFWAEWCGPCHTLAPVLEAAVADRAGQVELAKVDVDANQSLAQQHGVQGIPAVKGYRDGQVVAEFTGALHRAGVEEFLDRLVPSRADRHVESAREHLPDDVDAAVVELEAALRLEERHRDAALSLAELVADDDPDRATALATPHRPDPRAEAVLRDLSLAAGAGDLDDLSDEARASQDDDEVMLRYGRALAAADHHDEVIEVLLHGIGLAGDHRDELRDVLVDVLGALGSDDPRVPDARRRLASALF